MRKKRRALCVWECWTCHRKIRAGDVQKYGTHNLFGCNRCPGGKSLTLAMADFRQRKRNEKSYRERGVSSDTYLRGATGNILRDQKGSADDGKKSDPGRPE